MTLLKARNLSHAFDYPLFDAVDLDLEAGSSMAVIGVSGSGKSTLLHILSSLLKPLQGDVELLGRPLYDLDARSLVELRKNELGLIFQSHYLFKGFTAYENLEIASILSGEPIDDTLMQRLGIAPVLGQKVTELSGGQQQRISIARVLTKRPRLIFADEPTGNLDHATAEEVMQLFEAYLKAQEAALVLVTHDEALAHRCDRVYRLADRVLERVR